MKRRQISRYEQYWQLLLTAKDGKLTIKVPTHFVARVKKAIIKRKNVYQTINRGKGIRFSPLKIAVRTCEVERDKSYITFELDNIKAVDL